MAETIAKPSSEAKSASDLHNQQEFYKGLEHTSSKTLREEKASWTSPETDAAKSEVNAGVRRIDSDARAKIVGEKMQPNPDRDRVNKFLKDNRERIQSTIDRERGTSAEAKPRLNPIITEKRGLGGRSVKMDFGDRGIPSETRRLKPIITTESGLFRGKSVKMDFGERGVPTEQTKGLSGLPQAEVDKQFAEIAQNNPDLAAQTPEQTTQAEAQQNAQQTESAGVGKDATAEKGENKTKLTLDEAIQQFDSYVQGLDSTKDARLIDQVYNASEKISDNPNDPNALNDAIAFADDYLQILQRNQARGIDNVEEIAKYQAIKTAFQAEQQRRSNDAQGETQQNADQTEAAGADQAKEAELPPPPKYAAERRSARQQGERAQYQREKSEKQRKAKAEQEKIKEEFNKLIKNIQENAKQELSKLDENANFIKNQLENNKFYNILNNRKLKGELKDITKGSEDLKRDTKERVSRLEKIRDERIAALKASAEKVTANYNKLISKLNGQIARSESMIVASQKASRLREGLRGVGNFLGRAAGNFAGDFTEGYRTGRAEARQRAAAQNTGEQPDNVVSFEEARRNREATQNTERQAPGSATA